MDEDFYAEMLETANELIDEFGRDATITHMTQTVPDPSTPWVKESTPSTVTLKMVEIAQSMVTDDRTPLPANKLRVLVRADAIFTRQDTLNDFDGTVWSVEDIYPLRPGAVVLLNEVVLKR